MTEPKADPSADPSARPSGALAGVAGLVPPALAFAISVTAFFVAGPRDAMMALEEAGAGVYLVILSAMVAAISAGILVALAARVQIPAAIALAVGTWPWLAGLGSAAWGASQVAAAIENADPAMRAMFVARGLAESLYGRVFGGMIGAATLTGIGVGLAIASLAPRAPNRGAIGAIAGLVAGGLPLLSAIGALATGIGSGGAALIGAVALFSAIGCAIAGWGAGADVPAARSASLAAAAPVAFLLALVCAGGAAVVLPIIEVFAAIANADPGARVELLATFGDEISTPTTIAGSAWAVALVPCAVLAAWSASRARPTIVRAIGACAALFVAFATIALGSAAERNTYAMLAIEPTSPWDAVPGFEPLIAGGRGGDTPRMIVATDRIEAGGRSAPLAGIEAPGAPRTAAVELVRGSLIERPSDPFAIEQPPVEGGPVAPIAIDRRVSGTQLRALVGVAREAGAGAIAIAGVRERVDPATIARVPEQFRGIVGGPVISAVTAGLATDGAEADERLLHGRIVPAHASTALALEGRPGAEGATIPADARLDAWGSVPEATASVYLTIDPTTPAEVVALVVGRAIASGFEPVLLPGDEIPGSPSHPAEGALGLEGMGLGEGPGAGGIGRFGLGGVGGSGTGPAISPGTAVVRGSLDREVIQRVVRRHISEVTHCYEEGLANRPGLAGRVEARWTITATGSVEDATVTSSTLGAPWVESCITSAIARWTFPAPEGGGIVIVNYPFVFSETP